MRVRARVRVRGLPPVAPEHAVLDVLVRVRVRVGLRVRASARFRVRARASVRARV